MCGGSRQAADGHSVRPLLRGGSHNILEVREGAGRIAQTCSLASPPGNCGRAAKIFLGTARARRTTGHPLARRICSAWGDTLIITLTVWREPAVFFGRRALGGRLRRVTEQGALAPLAWFPARFFGREPGEHLDISQGKFRDFSPRDSGNT